MSPKVAATPGTLAASEKAAIKRAADLAMQGLYIDAFGTLQVTLEAVASQRAELRDALRGCVRDLEIAEPRLGGMQSPALRIARALLAKLEAK